MQFHQNAKGFGRGERVTITGVGTNGVHAKRVDGREVMLPLNEMKHFQAYRSEQVAFATGDRIRISQNGFTPEARRGGSG